MMMEIFWTPPHTPHPKNGVHDDDDDDNDDHGVYPHDHDQDVQVGGNLHPRACRGQTSPQSSSPNESSHAGFYASHMPLCTMQVGVGKCNVPHITKLSLKT